MRRLTLLVVALAVLTPVASASAKSFALDDADVLVRVAPDGSLKVRERITFAFHGPFTGAYRDIPLKAGERIDSISVAAGGRPYRPGGSAELGTPGPASQFGSAPQGDGRRIVWRFAAISGRRTFILRYRLRGVTKAYDDVADVELQVWGDTWKQGLGRLRARMQAPEPVTAAEARVYGHPADVRGETRFEGGLAHLRASAVPARRFVEMRLLFPRSMLQSTDGAQVIAGEAADRIAAEERDAASAGSRRVDDALDRPLRTILLLLLLGTLPAALLIVLVWVLVSRGPASPGYDREYEQEPPSDLPPALVAPLVRRTTRVGSPEFTATLFDLIRRGHYAAGPAPAVRGRRGRGAADLLLTRGTARRQLPPWDTQVARIVDRALEGAGDEGVALSQLSDRMASDRGRNAKSLASWRSAIAREFVQRRWYDRLGGTVLMAAAFVTLMLAVGLFASGVFAHDPSDREWGPVLRMGLGIAGLLDAAVLAVASTRRRLRHRWTPRAAEQAVRWQAFARYLRDFPRLQDAQPASVAVWERLLVYGIAFGLADRVVAAARLDAADGLAASPLLRPVMHGDAKLFYPTTDVSGLGSAPSSGGGWSGGGGDGGGGGFSGGGGEGSGGGGGGAW